MKYFVELEGETHEIEISQDGICIDGERVAIDLHQTGMPELYSVLVNDRSHEVLLHQGPDDWDLALYGHSFAVTVRDEAEQALMRGRGAHLEVDGDLKVDAPISGLVVTVPVAEGETVAPGQTLLVLEAMKMENEITAPRGGTVRDIAVAPGDRVDMDFTMMVLVSDD